MRTIALGEVSGLDEIGGQRVRTLVAVAGHDGREVMIVMLALPRASRPTARSQPQHNGVAYVPRSARLDAKNWITVKNAVRMRTMALARGRTAMYRAFAAYMALSGIMSLRPTLSGRCAVAISYLYDNLLDLHDAYPGEDWRPLRRLIHKQPPVSVCATKATATIMYVG